MDGRRACATIGMAALWGCCVVPWAHAMARKCDAGEVEERGYELVEIVAMDGESVPETVRMRWAAGVTVSGGSEHVTLHVTAIEESVRMESEAGG